MGRSVDIAAVQWEIRPIPNFDAFALQATALLDEAWGADIIVFPELFTLSLLTVFPDWRRRSMSDVVLIEEYTSQYREFFRAEAKKRGQHILGGSHLVREDGHYLNVAHLFQPSGHVLMHRKTHVFPGELEWLTEEGEDLLVWDLGFAIVGTMICYEAEFPDCAATLTEMGAEILLCPSFGFTENGFWRVRHCCAARAIENQVYVVNACTSGSPGPGRAAGFARSSILSPSDAPWAATGVVVEGETNTECVVRGSVDLDVLHENRVQGAAPTYRDRRRRADLYSSWGEHTAVTAHEHHRPQHWARVSD
jgi:predicted amidohydrolase